MQRPRRTFKYGQDGQGLFLQPWSRKATSLIFRLRLSQITINRFPSNGFRRFTLSAPQSWIYLSGVRAHHLSAWECLCINVLRWELDLYPGLTAWAVLSLYTGELFQCFSSLMAVLQGALMTESCTPALHPQYYSTGHPPRAPLCSRDSETVFTAPCSFLNSTLHQHWFPLCTEVCTHTCFNIYKYSKSYLKNITKYTHSCTPTAYARSSERHWRGRKREQPSPVFLIRANEPHLGNNRVKIIQLAMIKHFALDVFFF